MAASQSNIPLPITSALSLLGRRLTYSYRIPCSDRYSEPELGLVIRAAVSVVGSGEKDGITVRTDPNDPEIQHYYDLDEVRIYWIEPLRLP